jgi:uncharacterized protein (TIGR02246 family)
MPDLEQLSAWMAQYRRAWLSNDPKDIARLFTADASYRPAPYDAPWRGRRMIIEQWLAHEDQPGETEFTWHALAVTDDVAIVEGLTEFRAPQYVTYSNLWVIRLDQSGRCVEFVEWWMQHPAGPPKPG